MLLIKHSVRALLYETLFKPFVVCDDDTLKTTAVTVEITESNYTKLSIIAIVDNTSGCKRELHYVAHQDRS